MADHDLTTRRQLVGKLHRVGIPPEDVTLIAVDKPATENHRNWATITKLEDETKSTDASLADDADLTIAVQADEILIATMCIFYETTAAADFQFKFNLTQTEDKFEAFGLTDPHGATLPSTFHQDDMTTVTTLLGSGAGQGAVSASIRLQNGSTAGLFSFQWAQNTSDAGDTTMLAGSCLNYFMVGG